MTAPACPGIVVVWSGDAPRHAAHRIAGDGLVIDQSLVPWDPPISARLRTTRNRWSSRNHFEITGDQVTWRSGPIQRTREVDSDDRVILRISNTILAVVDDVRPFENVTPTRIAGLVVAGSLGGIARALDDAANAEEHLSIKGAAIVAHALARHYAAKLGNHAWFRPGGDQHLDHFLSTRSSVRTVVIELTRPLFERDVAAIQHLLETDLRFVVVRPDDHYVGWLPETLACDTLELPAVRFDELPQTIADRVAAVKPDATVRPEAIDLLLDRVEKLGEDRWTEALTRALDRWQPHARRDLGVPDLARDFP